MPPDIMLIRRALLSVTDKTGLTELGAALAARGVEILSTGGSAKVLRDAGVPVREVSEYTGFPEILDGRVKTLTPRIHGGLLGRRDLATHVAEMEKHEIAPIDLIAVNLYTFESVVTRGASFDECVESIDIGGPALLRAAAKNYDAVVVLSDPRQYGEFLKEFVAHEGTRRERRRGWAAAAYARTAAYDTAVATRFAAQDGVKFPSLLNVSATLRQKLRYGENPHQQAGLYVSNNRRLGVATAQQIQGKELSFNNLSDSDAAFECVAEFDEPTVAIVKHANPCGVASAENLELAWERALRCDPVSAFGGVIAVNRNLDEALAARIASVFTEAVIAPGATKGALEVLRSTGKLRLLLTGGLPDPADTSQVIRSVGGGYLVQTRDMHSAVNGSLRTVTARAPTTTELADLLFAFRVCKHVKSNAIVYVKDLATVGIGAGQMSRVDSARIATWKGAEAAAAAGLPRNLTHGGVAASDAFFPFTDGLAMTIDAGVTAVIQPGGSVRDSEVIAAADAAGIAMVFTGVRHFRH